MEVTKFGHGRYARSNALEHDKVSDINNLWFGKISLPA